MDGPFHLTPWRASDSCCLKLFEARDFALHQPVFGRIVVPWPMRRFAFSALADLKKARPYSIVALFLDVILADQGSILSK